MAGVKIGARQMYSWTLTCSLRDCQVPTAKWFCFSERILLLQREVGKKIQGHPVMEKGFSLYFCG